MAKKSGPVVGDLVARIEAPTVLYRVTSKHPKYVRVLPYQRSGKELLLFPVGRVWTDGGSQWSVIGKS